MPINKLEQISTKKGDSGDSSNFNNERLPKDDVLFDCLGTMDELSSMLGLAYHKVNNESLKEVQRMIQNINSYIATNPEHPLYQKLPHLDENVLSSLEIWIEDLLQECPLEPNFYLPGSETTEGGAYMDMARAIARRAERVLVKYIRQTRRTDLDFVLKFTNRLSDFLFVYARYLSYK